MTFLGTIIEDPNEVVNWSTAAIQDAERDFLDNEIHNVRQALTDSSNFGADSQSLSYRLTTSRNGYYYYAAQTPFKKISRSVVVGMNKDDQQQPLIVAKFEFTFHDNNEVRYTKLFRLLLKMIEKNLNNPHWSAQFNLIWSNYGKTKMIDCVDTFTKLIKNYISNQETQKRRICFWLSKHNCNLKIDDNINSSVNYNINYNAFVTGNFGSTTQGKTFYSSQLTTAVTCQHPPHIVSSTLKTCDTTIAFPNRANPLPTLTQNSNHKNNSNQHKNANNSNPKQHGLYTLVCKYISLFVLYCIIY